MSREVFVPTRECSTSLSHKKKLNFDYTSYSRLLRSFLFTSRPIGTRSFCAMLMVMGDWHVRQPALFSLLPAPA